MSETDKRLTYGVVMDAIRSKGIEKVRAIVYGAEDEKNRNEGVAITMWVNSRQARDELITKLEK